MIGRRVRSRVLFCAASIHLGKIKESSEMSGNSRRLNSAYAGPLIKLRRASDNALLDIYARADGWLDQPAVVAHCGASLDTTDTWYDQSGFARNMVQATTSRQYQIYDGAAVRTKNGRPAAYVTVEDSGYFAGTPSYTGTQVSGVLVASLTSTAVTGEPSAAWFLSLLDTSSNNDVSSTTRAILIGRRGGSTPTTNWGTRRSSSWYADMPSAGVDTLDQVVAIYTGSQAQLYRRNGTPVTATPVITKLASHESPPPPPRSIPSPPEFTIGLLGIVVFGIGIGFVIADAQPDARVSTPSTTTTTATLINSSAVEPEPTTSTTTELVPTYEELDPRY
jgi:hypothetical protein